MSVCTVTDVSVIMGRLSHPSSFFPSKPGNNFVERHNVPGENGILWFCYNLKPCIIQAGTESYVKDI